MLKPATIGTIIAALAATAAAAAPSIWVGTWGASPLPPSPGFGQFPGTPTLQDVTLIQVLHVSAGGARVRVRFSNEYGSKPLTIGAARIAVGYKAGGPPTASAALTFGGKPGAVIPAGAPILSDPVILPVKARSDVAVSLYLPPQDAGPCTCHSTAMAKGLIADHDQTAAIDGGAAPAGKPLQTRAFVSGVEVSGPEPAKAVVVLGDSISDGVGSTTDANRRWPDLLSEKLNTRDAGKRMWGVVNEGISGNRLLADGAGQSALVRFDRDVLSAPGAAYLVIFEGVNDLGIGHFKPTGGPNFASALPKAPADADSLIGAYRQLIERAHAHGLKVIGATITPYEGASYWSAEGEADRQKINTWIRTSGAFDGVLDFDKAWSDPDHPSQIKAGWHAGDHLHGSDAGYQVLADSIDLKLFQ